MVDIIKAVIELVIKIWLQCCLGIFILTIIYITYRILEFMENERVELLRRQEAARRAGRIKRAEMK